MNSYRDIESVSQRSPVAQDIYTTYIRPGSNQEVNIDYPFRQDIQLALAQAPVEIFDKAQKEVLGLLLMDILPKYRR